MKPKTFLCLALFLSGGLLGCSTASRCGCEVQSPEVADVAKVELKVVKVDSEETSGEDGSGKNAVDGNSSTIWHTQWQGNSPGLPHQIIIELFPPSVIKGFTYLPRQDESDHGTIKDFEFYASDNDRNFGQPVLKGAFGPGKGEKIETFAPVKCRFIKLKALSEINGLPWTSAAEIRVLQSDEDVSAKDYGRGNLGPTGRDAAAPHISTKPVAIDLFIANPASTTNATNLNAAAFLPNIFGRIEQQFPELGSTGMASGTSSPAEALHGVEYASGGFCLLKNPRYQPFESSRDGGRIPRADLHVTIHRYASSGDALKDLETSLMLRPAAFQATENYNGGILYRYLGASGDVGTAICQHGPYVVELNRYNDAASPLMKVLDIVLAELDAASSKPD